MMNNEQALQALNAKNKIYAMVGGAYVNEVKLNLQTVTLSPFHQKASFLDRNQINWLQQILKDVTFYQIKVQAQSVEYDPSYWKVDKEEEGNNK
ncbi:hypothetical protein 278BB001_274 [Bacillus phage 278BB001]|nr:hypothetical protein 278BB001_12 [Bacillus phage 278BB001]QZA70418.1 hypothetical protein 278BB001_274 [Bacillus phage 278BB001]